MKKKKPILRILREAILMLLVLIIASGIGYQCSKTPEQHENDIRYLRTMLLSKGIYLKYKLPERDMDGMLLWDSAGQENGKEKQLKSSIVDYFYIDLGQAIKLSDKIVRGKVQSRSTQTKGLPIYKSDGSIYDFDPYREVTVEVSDVIKGDKSQKMILYKEPGGETETYIYKQDELEPLEIGREYIFFLYKNNTFVNPAAVIAISDGQVWVSDMVCPKYLQVEGERVYAQRVPVDTYMNAVRMKYWSVTAIKVLVIIVALGVVLVIFYFVCRNLYKTTRFVVHRIKSRKG